MRAHAFVAVRRPDSPDPDMWECTLSGPDADTLASAASYGARRRGFEPFRVVLVELPDKPPDPTIHGFDQEAIRLFRQQQRKKGAKRR